MKRRILRTIPRYRGFSGRPRRGIAVPHASYAECIATIRRQTERLASLSSRSLSERSTELKERVAAGACINGKEVVLEAYALTTEAVRRETGLTYFDVQLAAGLVLASGAVAEVQTGEGKTITTALPAYLPALTGMGVHVATTNDYLSIRDFEQLPPVYDSLGMRVGLLEPQAPPAQKQAAYACDITYGPGYEFGFDFLRDQVTLRSRLQEPLGVAHLQRLMAR